MKHKKKLIEVALPLEAINKASAREKSIRHGHPSTLHLADVGRMPAERSAITFSAKMAEPLSLSAMRGLEDREKLSLALLSGPFCPRVPGRGSNRPRRPPNPEPRAPRAAGCRVHGSTSA